MTIWTRKRGRSDIPRLPRRQPAIGAYANEHGHHDLAREALTRAAGHGSPGAGRLYAAASFLVFSQDEVDRARDLLGQTEAAGDGRLFTSVVEAALADHNEGAADSRRVAEVLAGARQHLGGEGWWPVSSWSGGSR
ncbi:MAG TPA: hypothetical protein VGI74_14580 [Streptosporangiaceae bacterium]|jgi:hypothetical protein